MHLRKNNQDYIEPINANDSYYTVEFSNDDIERLKSKRKNKLLEITGYTAVLSAGVTALSFFLGGPIGAAIAGVVMGAITMGIASLGTDAINKEANYAKNKLSEMTEGFIDSPSTTAIAKKFYIVNNQHGQKFIQTKKPVGMRRETINDEKISFKKVEAVKALVSESEKGFANEKQPESFFSKICNFFSSSTKSTSGQGRAPMNFSAYRAR